MLDRQLTSWVLFVFTLIISGQSEDSILESPKIIKEINIERLFESEKEKPVQLLLSAKYHQTNEDVIVDLNFSTQKGKNDKGNLFIFDVDYSLEEGSEITINISHKFNKYHSISLPANHVYLLSDGEKWFLLATGSKKESVLAEFHVNVYRIFLNSNKIKGKININVNKACNCNISDAPGSDPQKHLTFKSGVKTNTSSDNIFNWIDKFTSHKNDIVKWSKKNNNCFIDLSICIKK